MSTADTSKATAQGIASGSKVIGAHRSPGRRHGSGCVSGGHGPKQRHRKPELERRCCAAPRRQRGARRAGRGPGPSGRPRWREPGA